MLLLNSMKNRSCLIRISEKDEQLLKLKSIILNIDRSKLFRNGAYSYWKTDGMFDAEKLFSVYKDGDESQSKLVVSLLVEFLRMYGYPHRKMSKKDLNAEMKRIEFTKSPLLEEGHLQTNTVGLAAANYFHPHMVKVRCLSKYHAPYDVFKNDILLSDAINRWMELGNKPTLSGIRRILRTRDGVRSVVNFKPAIAKYFYDNYSPVGGNVLDPCAGYGGRLCGLIAAGGNRFYHGIDPCADTAVGNTKLAAFYANQFDTISGEQNFPFKFRFDLGCAEDILPLLPDSAYNLVFTSPPYFDVEKYDTTPNQSYMRYSDYESWLNKFLSVVVRESKRVCVSSGYVIINVKNYKKFRIADDIVKIAKSLDLLLVKTYNMRLTNSEFHRKKDKPNWHTEPVFVFRKFGE